MRRLAIILSIGLQIVLRVNAQKPLGELDGLHRQYKEGAVSHYLMTGDNDGWRYSVLATDVVKRDASGHFYEEISWSDLKSNAGMALNPASLALRQTVSLEDPASYMKVPNLAAVQPLLIGPITDTLTFYSDLLLALRANLSQTGQTAYVARETPNSWADGQRVLIGGDVVDFSLKVEAVDPRTTRKHSWFSTYLLRRFMFISQPGGCRWRRRQSRTTLSRYPRWTMALQRRQASRRLMCDL